MTDTSIGFLLNQLPDDAKFWVRHLHIDDRIHVERLLKETGVENFSRYWKEHRAELNAIKNF